MTWLTEQPGYILALGGLLVVLIAAGWLQTGRRILLVFAVLAALLTAGLLILERKVKTDREQVTETLQRIAATVASNDVDALLEFIHQDAKQIRARAASEMPQYDFQKVSIKRNLRIDVDADHLPPKAVAEFNVVVVVSDRSGYVQGGTYPRFVVLTFYKDDDRWRVYDYEHHPPQEGWRQR